MVRHCPRLATAAFAFLSVASACGMDPNKDKTGAKVEVTPSPVPTPADVEFEGYIQRAFALRVNGVSFTDSEHFYMRFIDDLILKDKAYAEALKDAKIEVQGEYGLERFGANVALFMAPQGNEGSLFEARTDSQGKFAVKVKPKALSETYKARIVLRIGLKISHPDQSVESFCYLLAGQRDGIKISEASKPVIFDDFKTQLNAYGCKQVEDKIAIPTKATSTSNPVGSTPASSVPNVELGSAVEVSLPFGANDEGGEQTLSLQPSLDGSSLVVLRSLITDKNTGVKTLPTFLLTQSGGSWSVTPSVRMAEGSVFGALTKVGSGFVGLGSGVNGDSSKDALVQFDGSGTRLGSEAVDVGYQGEHRKSFVWCAGTAPRAGVIVGASNGLQGSWLAPVNVGVSTLLGAKVEGPQSGKYAGAASSMCDDKRIVALAADRGSIQVLNPNLVPQRTYGLSRFLFTKADLDSLKVALVGGEVYGVVSKASGLTLRKLKLVD